jgi:NAD+ synthase (glutamine-hydrolysing)
MQDGFIKVAAGTPKIRVADCSYNARQIITLMREAAEQGVRVLCLPELCLTGYTCEDLFLQSVLMRGAEEGLTAILEATRDLDMLAAVGLPVQRENKLFNCAAVIHRGKLLGLVPKTHIPNYGEFYESRWFAPGSLDMTYSCAFCGQQVPLGSSQLFRIQSMPNLTIGVEICEDLWAVTPPSSHLAALGATLILNLSASDEELGKAERRRRLIAGQSAKLCCGYIYASAGEGESTSDLVFSGHDMVAENGDILAETRFSQGLTISEIDVDRLADERRKKNTFPRQELREDLLTHGLHNCSLTLAPSLTTLTRPISPTPFFPQDPGELATQCGEALAIAALGLKKRLEHTGVKTCVIGLSGGLDSTLALLITARAYDMLGLDRRDILTVTMPCFGTTKRTRSNAETLAQRVGAELRVVDISAAVTQHFKDIGQSMDDQDVTFENAQARERTQVLMDLANQTGGLVIGTGDLSELALGWCTYNGDHMSMYAVNAGIPKTLVRHLVSYAARENSQSDPALSAVLRDILDTPVSPELLPPAQGEISQVTEHIVGPYELHDFFLYYVTCYNAPPRKVLRLAEKAFESRYDREALLKWLKTFYRRFFSQQFKRSCVPDGPKVGSVSLSPRGDWRMPSDAVATLWMEEVEKLNG